MPDTTAADQRPTSQHTTMESQASRASSVSAWSRGTMRNESLMVQEARQRNEPFILWPREARPVYISELAEMDVTRLKQLASDLSIEISEININLNLLYTEFNKTPQNMPVARREIRITIKRLTYKNSQLKLLCAEAKSIVNAFIQKPKKAAKPRKLSGIEEAEKQISYLQRSTFFKILKEKLGNNVVSALEMEAMENTIEPFIEWAKSKSVPDDTINHIIDHKLKDCRSRLYSLQQRETDSDTTAADSPQCQA
jgi:hypothetical protein